MEEDHIDTTYVGFFLTQKHKCVENIQYFFPP